ncbi:MAG: thiazole synthase [Alistipes ihumii]
MSEAVRQRGELVTVALKRVELENPQDDILSHLDTGAWVCCPIPRACAMPAGGFAAQLAREALGTNWMKLEIHPDPRYLFPDPVETLKAAEELVKDGFVVMPYVHADPVLCRRLEDVGVACVMPLGAPIGSNRGLRTRDLLRIIIEQSTVPVVVDAGIGAPSHAAEAMEMGADAVLVNTAIAVAADPVAMAGAFRMAVEAGRTAFEAQLAPERAGASATSPLNPFLDSIKELEQ